MLKYFSDTLVCLCRALEVLLGTNLLADILGLASVLVKAWLGQMDGGTDLLYAHRLLRSLGQLLNCLLVEAQILLAADEDNGQALAEMQDFGDPLCHLVSVCTNQIAQ